MLEKFEAKRKGRVEEPLILSIDDLKEAADKRLDESVRGKASQLLTLSEIVLCPVRP